MANQEWKTGEKAPENGTYKVKSLVNGGSSSSDNTEIKLNEGDQFPPLPSENEAAYWEKA